MTDRYVTQIEHQSDRFVYLSAKIDRFSDRIDRFFRDGEDWHQQRHCVSLTRAVNQTTASQPCAVSALVRPTHGRTRWWTSARVWVGWRPVQRWTDRLAAWALVR